MADDWGNDGWGDEDDDDDVWASMMTSGRPPAQSSVSDVEPSVTSAFDAELPAEPAMTINEVFRSYVLCTHYGLLMGLSGSYRS